MLLKTPFIWCWTLQGFLGNVCEERVVAESWLCSSPSTNRQRKHAAEGVRWIFHLVTFFSQNSPEGQHKLPPCALSLSGQQWQIIIMLHVPLTSYHCQMEVAKDHTVSLGRFSVSGIFPEDEYRLLHGSKKEEQTFWKAWNPWGLCWTQLRSNFWVREEVAHNLRGPADVCSAADLLFFTQSSFLVVSERFLFCPVILQ